MNPFLVRFRQRWVSRNPHLQWLEAYFDRRKRQLIREHLVDDKIELKMLKRRRAKRKRLARIRRKHWSIDYGWQHGYENHHRF